MGFMVGERTSYNAVLETLEEVTGALATRQVTHRVLMIRTGRPFSATHVSADHILQKIRPPGTALADLPDVRMTFYDEISAEIAHGNLGFADHLGAALRREGLEWKPTSVRDFVSTWCPPSLPRQAP